MRGPARGRPVGIALVAVLGAAACVAGVRHRFFDRDEIHHAHVTWLIAQGDRPFHDFFASHSPFLWYPIATLWRVLPESPAALLPLRVVGVVGNGLATVTMAAAWAAAQRDLPLAWLIVGVAGVAVGLDALDYAIEFRPDGWSTALLFLACLLFPKLAARPPALILAPLSDDWGYERGQWAAVRAYLAVHRDAYVVVDRGLIGPAWVRRDLAGPGAAAGGGR